MALVEEASGTQTATIGTEHTLSTPTTNKTRVLVVDMNNMVSGDTLELRIKSKVLSADSNQLAYLATFVGAQTQPNLYSVPVPMNNGGQFTLKQTAGTGRAFKWAVLTLD